LASFIGNFQTTQPLIFNRSHASIDGAKIQNLPRKEAFFGEKLQKNVILLAIFDFIPIFAT